MRLIAFHITTTGRENSIWNISVMTWTRLKLWARRCLVYQTGRDRKLIKCRLPWSFLKRFLFELSYLFIYLFRWGIFINTSTVQSYRQFAGDYRRISLQGLSSSAEKFCNFFCSFGLLFPINTFQLSQRTGTQSAAFLRRFAITNMCSEVVIYVLHVYASIS